MGIKDLRRELGMSDTAVRQQLRSLRADGLIQASRQETQGPGRPGRQYELSDEARRLFARYSEDLVLNLYAELLADQGPEVVRSLLDRVGQRLARQYAREVSGDLLHDKVRSLAMVLDARGIMSEVSQEAELIVLHEFSCPYHELASAHREICDMEKNMIAQVLDADVELSNCMMDGHNGCSFVVRPSDEEQHPPRKAVVEFRY